MALILSRRISVLLESLLREAALLLGANCEWDDLGCWGLWCALCVQTLTSVSRDLLYQCGVKQAPQLSLTG